MCAVVDKVFKTHAVACHCWNCPISIILFLTGATISISTTKGSKFGNNCLGRNGQWATTVSYSIGIVGAVHLREAAGPKYQNLYRNCPFYLSTSCLQTIITEVSQSELHDNNTKHKRCKLRHCSYPSFDPLLTYLKGLEEPIPTWQHVFWQSYLSSCSFFAFSSISFSFCLCEDDEARNLCISSITETLPLLPEGAFSLVSLVCPVLPSQLGGLVDVPHTSCSVGSLSHSASFQRWRSLPNMQCVHVIYQWGYTAIESELTIQLLRI